MGLALLLMLGQLAGSGTSPSGTQGVAQVIAAGETAEKANDAAGMLRASCALAHANAHPSGDTPDLTRIWRAKAQSLGAIETPETCPAWRGRTRGPAYHAGIVRAHDAYSTDQVFTGGERAEVSVEANGDAPVTLSVYGMHGETMCSVNASGRNEACGWLPTWTESFNISIKNEGDTDQRFYLITN